MEVNGWAKTIGMGVGAAVIVIGGGFSALNFGTDMIAPAKLRPATIEQLMEKLGALERRVDELSRPGGPVPMSNVTRERFEAVERRCEEIERNVRENTNRIVDLARSSKNR